MEQDMAEINAMPEEDRKLFERYAGDNLEQISTLTPLDLAHAMEDTETELIKKYGAERLAELKRAMNGTLLNSRQNRPCNPPTT